MQTCTAPMSADPITLDPDGDPDFQAGWTCDWTAANGDGCTAVTPVSCEGTDWPPLTSWQRYAQERRAGERVPPTVSVWREQDRRRQAMVAGERAPQDRQVAWGPGPSCEGTVQS